MPTFRPINLSYQEFGFGGQHVVTTKLLGKQPPVERFLKVLPLVLLEQLLPILPKAWLFQISFKVYEICNILPITAICVYSGKICIACNQRTSEDILQ
jgi:hypothetical protein